MEGSLHEPNRFDIEGVSIRLLVIPKVD